MSKTGILALGLRFATEAVPVARRLAPRFRHMEGDNRLEQMQLEAQVRSLTQAGALRRLRESGWIPGIVYGHSHQPVSISVPESWFSHHHVRGNVFVKLNVGGEVIDAIVRDYQRDPLSKRIQHIDFFRVDVQSKIDGSVPVHLHGLSQVERRGGIVQQQLRELHIRALPTEVPEYVSVDVAGLHIGDQVKVKDVLLPPGVELRSDADEVIASVVAPKQTVNSTTADEPSTIQ
jgi:large subunit ribosomal protein L25